MGMSSSASVSELVQAVRDGQMQEVQRLVLSNGVDVNSPCAWGKAPLTIACERSTLCNGSLVVPSKRAAQT